MIEEIEVDEYKIALVGKWSETDDAPSPSVEVLQAFYKGESLYDICNKSRVSPGELMSLLHKEMVGLYDAVVYIQKMLAFYRDEAVKMSDSVKQTVVASDSASAYRQGYAEGAYVGSNKIAQAITDTSNKISLLTEIAR
jgi:hypothetical protein